MRLFRRWLPALAVPYACSFTVRTTPPTATQQRPLSMALYAVNEESLNLKIELAAYLEKRKEVNADEEAKAEVGKVIGGTKGNKILEYVSGAPNKAIVVDEVPNIFDYDQLTKYGYGHLVTPIMAAGGRLEMYRLMNMEPPPPPKRIQPKKAPKLVIDRKGESDPARYSGLKMGQVLDDETMARALEEANRKRKRGESLRPKLVEETYVMPFADKRNVGARQTPDWTPELMDEEGIKRGKAIAWARKAKAGEFVKDPFEAMTIDGAIRLYSIFVSGVVAFGFGRATPSFLEMINAQESGIQEVMQVPALIALFVAVGSSVVNGVVMAPEKKRSQVVWAVKGLFGGPVATAQLRTLDQLQTREEQGMSDN